MAVQADVAAYTATIDAAVPRDASPLQQGDIDSWDEIRALFLHLADTLFDEATMQAVVLTAGIIVNTMIANGAIRSAHIGDNQVLTSKIAASAVRERNIQTGAVTHTKLGTGAVEHDNLADDSVGSDQLQDDAVQEAHIEANAVRTAAINDGSVTRAKLASAVQAMLRTNAQADTRSDNRIGALVDADWIDMQFGRSLEAMGPKTLIWSLPDPYSGTAASLDTTFEQQGADNDWVVTGQYLFRLQSATTERWIRVPGVQLSSFVAGTDGGTVTPGTNALVVHGVTGLTDPFRSSFEMYIGLTLNNRVLLASNSDSTAVKVQLYRLDELTPAYLRDWDILTAQDGQGNLATTVTTLQELANAVDALATGSGGLNQAAVDARIYNRVAAMLTGNTETGIAVTYETSDNTIDFVVTGGGSTPSLPTHQIYAAYGADNTWTASEFTTAGTMQASTTNGMLTLSGATGREYVAFWSAEQLTVINPVGRLALPPTDNDIRNYTEARLTISSVNGYLYTNATDAPAGYINGEWRFA